MPEDAHPKNELTGNAARVDRYLQLCEDRNLEEASAFLAPDVRMEFPGPVVYRSLAEQVAAPGRPYQWVRKRRLRYLEGETEGVPTVVSIGELYGVDLDGRPFDGIRYVDCFVIRDGLIAEQLVWNDLALSGLVPRPA